MMEQISHFLFRKACKSSILIPKYCASQECQNPFFVFYILSYNNHIFLWIYPVFYNETNTVLNKHKVVQNYDVKDKIKKKKVKLICI